MAVVLGFMGYKVDSNDCLRTTSTGNLTSVQDRMGIMLFLTVMVKYLSMMNAIVFIENAAIFKRESIAKYYRKKFKTRLIHYPQFFTASYLFL